MKMSKFAVIILIALTSCGNPIIRKPIVKKTASFTNQSINFNKNLNKLEENFFKQWMKKDSLNTYFESDKGFWYKYNIKSSNSYSPKFGELLNYSFAIYSISNEPIYTYDEVGIKSYLVDKQEIPEGIRNGLKLMHEGDEITCLFPSHKMYGYVGDGNKIERNQPVIVKLKLIKINKKNEVK